MNASDLFVKALENEGVEYVFGVPGEENLNFVESLRNSSIKLVVTRHEQVAGFMAATYGRLTGKPGVCLSTLGPGATNLVTSAAFAQLGGMPMFMITGQKPIKKSKQGHFQILDVVQMMRPLTKFTKQIVNGNTIPALVREAFRTAMEERPGAVHLELPEDIASEDVNDTEIFALQQIRRPAGDEKAIAIAVSMIESAKFPLILIGAAANRRTVSNMLTEFVDKTGIPFFTTQMGKGVIDERHSLYLGCAALSSKDLLHQAIERADCIINVGHDVIEKPPFFMRRDQQVIHVNYFSAKVDDVYFPQWEVIGDIGNVVWQIKERISVSLSWDFEPFLQTKKQIETQIAECVNDARFPVSPDRFVADVRRAMPDDGMLALDNGMYKIWFARNYKTHHRNTILLDNALATMGAGLPSAMVSKMVYPERKVMAVVGDGGFMMNSQDLETAVRLNLDIVILLLNDNGYGMIQWKQRGMGYQDFGLTFGNPDFVKYAESYGAHGVRIPRAEDLLPTLKERLEMKGMHLIELPIDYHLNEGLSS